MDKVEVKRIEYLRDVDTNSYLPQVIGDADEVKRTNLAQDIELKKLWAMVNKQFYNRFILTADDEGLERYIKLLGQDITGTTEEKRRKVHYEWNKNIIYTDRSVRGILNDLLGEEAYDMDIEYGKYTVNFKIILNYTDVSPDYVYKELRLMVPANMWIKFTVLRITDHKIYYGLVEQRKNKSTLYPATGEDHEESLEIYYGACPYAKRIRVSDRPIDVWLYDDIQREVVTEKERRLKYGKDLS